MVRQSRTVELTLYGMVVVALAATLGVYVYDVGWAPEAEGMYAEFGARVSQGHWPHLHFEDSSLGGLSFLNAVLFAVGGTSILTLRVFLLSVFAIGSVAMVVLLSRATRVVTASVVAMVCLLWGPPVFLIPGPKWYVVVLGMMSCLTIIRYSEDGRVKWLVVTGIFSGIGILIHPPSALMLVIAVTVSIFLLPAGDRKVEAEEGAATEEDVSEPGTGTTVERDASKPVPEILAARYIVLTLALVCAGLVVWQQESFGSLLYYIIGPAAVAAMLLYMEMKQPSELVGYRVRRANLGRYCFSTIAMVLPFLLALAAKGGVTAVVEAARASAVRPYLSVGPANIEALAPLYLAVLLGACLLAGLLVAALRFEWPTWVGALLLAGIVLTLFSSIVPMAEQANYRWAWSVIELAIPAVIVAGAVLLFPGRLRTVFRLNERQTNVATLLLIMMTCFSFLRLPDNSHASLLYVFPFFVGFVVVLFSAYLESAIPRVSRASNVAVYSCLLCLGLFSWLYNVRSETSDIGQRWSPVFMHDQIRLDRARIYTTKADIRAYEGMARVINTCTDEDDKIVAFPNSHITYFLTDKTNPIFGYGMPRLRGGDSLKEAVESALATEGANARVLIYNSRMDPDGEIHKHREVKRDIAKRIPVQLQYGHFMTFSPRIEWVFHEKQKRPNPASAARIRRLKKFPWGYYEADEWESLKNSYSATVKQQDLYKLDSGNVDDVGGNVDDVGPVVPIPTENEQPDTRGQNGDDNGPDAKDGPEVKEKPVDE